MQLTEGTLFHDRYTLVRLIGRGGFSEVWLATDKYTGLELALKVYAPNGGTDDTSIAIFSDEIRRVYNLSHPNLLKPQHFAVCEGMPYIVMPYCANGSVVKQIGKMSEAEIWTLLHDVATGLAYLHEQHIVHQDIKPDNILQAADGHYLITDFGISARTRTTLTKTQAISDTSAGTSAYMAPERFGSKPAPTFASDIWALGATLFELIEGYVPFGDGALPAGLLQKNGAEIPNITQPISPALSHVIRLMLACETWDRPTAETLAAWAANPALVKPAAAASSRSTVRRVTTPPPTDAAKPKAKKRYGWLLFLGIILTAIVVGVVARVKQEPIEQEPTEVETRTFTVPGSDISFTMVYVQGGTFTMGATSEQGSDAYDWEKPTHRVTLSSYYIGQTEVTQALWQAVMGNNPSHFRGANKPVESVSYNDCKAFISKLNSLTGQNFRLPTEAEWEFAARGGNRSRGYKYAGSDNLSTVAWYDGNSGYATHPVAQKSPNELGLYDMSGNVWEWCNDWYGDYSSNAQTNPQGPYSGSYRVLRGGSYILARYCRVSYRIYITPSCSSSGLGLRLAL